MKLTNWMSSAFVVAAALSSCSSETENFSQVAPGTVQLTSTLNNGAFSRVAADWEGTEEVGLYMVSAVDASAVGNVVNKRYTVAVGGALTAANGVEATYPTDGSQVGFYSYYPYSVAAFGGVYPVDLSSDGDNDLLYATTEAIYDQTTASAVNLQYSHQLARLVLDVKYNGAVATDVAATIFRNTTASFTLATGVLADAATPVALSMEANGAVEGRVSALVLPGEEADSKVNFSIDGKSFTWNLGTTAFEAGKQYRYTINLTATAAPEVDASLDSTIDGWIEEDGGDQNIGEDEKPQLEVTYEQPTFVGALKAGVETVDAKLVLNYTSNLAEEVVLLVEVNGVGGVQAIVNGFQILVAGQGTIEVPVTGTPLEAGDVNFVLSIDGEDIGALTIPVEAAEEGNGEGEGDAPVYTSNIDLAANGTSTQYYAHKVTVNGSTEEYPCVKLGSGSSVGLWTTNALGSMAVGAAKLKIYGVGWNGKKSTLSITVNNGGSITDYAGPYSLIANTGASNSTPYKLVDFSDDYLLELDIEGFTTETTLTFETIKDGAAILFGINIE